MPVALLLALALATPALAADPAPTVDATWHLEHVFASVDAFQAERDAVVADLPKVAACKGTLGKDAATLLACLDAQSLLQQRMGRLWTYASDHANADLRDDAWRGRRDDVALVNQQYSTATSWFEPELKELGSERVEAMIAAEPGLAPYAWPLRVSLRHAAHILSPAEERILALGGVVLDAPGTTYQTLAYSELPWPKINLADGTSPVLNQAQYTLLRASPDAALRKQVYDTFFGTLGGYQDTAGSLLGTQMASHWWVAQARGYASSAEAALDGSLVPRQIYDTLVRETRANLPTLHRYLKLRQRMLGVEQLGYQDLYVPLVNLDKKFPLEDAQRTVLTAVAPLGRDYVNNMRAGFAGGWMDVYPTPGKQGGAYMDDAAYGVHPYLLLNYNDDYESMSTLAHEWGHAMHSYSSMKSQPYATSQYATFIAEIASTFNEALLVDMMIAKSKTDDEKLFYLGQALESLRTTYFRQAMFGEFELAMHEKVEKGEPLTGATLTTMYGDMLRDYYGAADGTCTVDPAYAVEWAYIPHFYYNYYVWQYATSIAASSLLAERVERHQPGARDRYLALLAAGGSAEPDVLLKAAGVDMTSPEPYRAVATRMNAIMDRIETILAKREKN